VRDVQPKAEQAVRAAWASTLVEWTAGRWGVARDRGDALVWFELGRADGCGGEQFGSTRVAIV
jgi:hypothetical protein